MAFCISLSLIPLIMVMTPDVNVWGHLLLFIQHIVVKTLIVAANFYEGWSHVAPKSKNWFLACLTISTIYPALLIIDFAYYEYNPGKVLIPWWITMFFDLSWFGFLATTSRFLPPAPHIRIK
jgi:hypothetical protein